MKSARGTLSCDPIELRDILNAAPTGKAGGPDGLPSQALKALPFTQIKQIAAAFTRLANDFTYHSEHRPQIWDLVGAVLIPKKPKADQLDQYRPISLMSQVQKLYGRWLLTQAKPVLDGQISENQSGFRAHRQAAEPLFTLLRITELAREALIYNLTREIVDAKMRSTLFGCKPAQDIPLKGGMKQGAPESGLLFVATIDRALHKLKAVWEGARESHCKAATSLM